MKIRIFLIPFLSILVIGGCSKNNLKKNENQMFSSSVYEGTRVKENQYTSTVQLRGRKSSCTGVLIDYKTVKTAAHCLHSPYPNDAPNFKKFIKETRIIVGTGVVGDQNISFKISYVAIHPDYYMTYKYMDKNRIDISTQNDYAYLELETPVPAHLVTIIPPISKAEEKNLLRTGHDIEVVGFGKDENKVTGTKKYLKTKLIQKSHSRFIIGHDNKGVCSGDSGGPTFATLPNGEKRVISLSSHIRGLCGDESTRYNSWVAPITIGMDFMQADRLRRAGEKFEKNGKFKQAFDSYLQALELVPENIDLAVKFLALVNVEDEGFEYVDLATDYYFYNMGYKSYLQGDFEQAIKFLSSVNTYPKPSQKVKELDLALLYVWQKNLTEAKQYFLSFLENSDLSTLSYGNFKSATKLAIIFKESEIGLEFVEMMFRMDPNQSELHFMYGSLYYQLGQHETALEHFDKYLDLDINLSERSTVSSLKVNCLLALKASDEKIKEFIVKERQYNKQLKVSRLKSLKASRQWKKLALEVARFKKLYPMSIDSYYFEALAYSETEKMDIALETVNKGIQLHPLSADLFNLKGCLLEEMNGERSEIIRAYELALAVNPDHPKATANLIGVLKKDSASWDEADRLFRAKVDRGTAIMNDYEKAMKLYSSSGEWQKLSEVLERLIQFDPSNQSYYAQLARVEFELGDAARAEKLAKDVLDMPFTFDRTIRKEMKKIIKKLNRSSWF